MFLEISSPTERYRKRGAHIVSNIVSRIVACGLESVLGLLHLQLPLPVEAVFQELYRHRGNEEQQDKVGAIVIDVRTMMCEP